MPDYPLYWKLGRPQALEQVSGETTVEDVEAGGEYEVTVDHSETAVFAFAEPPRVTPVEGLVCLLCCDGTDGGQFRLLVRAGDDFGEGYYGPVDVDLVWARRGVLDGPE